MIVKEEDYGINVAEKAIKILSRLVELKQTNPGIAMYDIVDIVDAGLPKKLSSLGDDPYIFSSDKVS